MRKSSLLPLIIIFSIALWIPGYLRRDLWQPDEARYAYVAKEMKADNHWFVPHRHGVPYAHKPPLMFWLINAGSVVTGGEIGKIATRLPSLLGVILTLWAASSIAALWYDRRTALRTVFITATTFAIWWRAGWGQIDMLLCGLEMTSLYLLFADDIHRTRWRPALAFIFFGLGIMAKGPVGFIIPLGAYITANLAAGKSRNLMRFHWLWCLPVTLLLPAAWLLAAKKTGAPDAYFHELLFDQNAGRAAGGLGHIQPLYYYPEYLLLDGLPWIIFLPIAIWALIKKMREKTDPETEDNRKAGLFMPLGWFCFVVLFFSLLPTKRSLYILSAYPALAIIVSSAWTRLADLPRKAVQISSGLTTGLIAGTGVILLIIQRIRPDIPLGYALTAPCGVVLFIGAASLFFNFKKFGPALRWMYQLAGMMVVIYLITSLAILPKFNAMKTPHELVSVVQRYLPERHPLMLFRINAEIFPYYCDRKAIVYWGEDDFKRSLKFYNEGVAIFLKSVWDQKQETYSRFGKTGTFKIGHKEYIWFAFRIHD